MKPSVALQEHRSELPALAARFGLRNVRIFGSTLRAEDREDSDLDLLVDPTPHETSLFEIVGFKHAAQDLLGVPVDVRTPNDIHERFRSQVLREARAL